VPYEWEADDAHYNPSLRDATFVVAGGPGQLPGAQSAALRTFGRPARVYGYDGYIIMVWNTNLLSRLGQPGIT
jgi:cell division ATPase FtsA